jgi:GT2 family glycosyltransferase
MIGAIIPFYQRQDQLQQCLDCLKRQTVPVEIFVRDNSTDNILFTAAVNEGLTHFLKLDRNYFLIVNQDMYLRPDAVEQMILLMEKQPRCGIAAPLQLLAGDSDQVICGGLEAFPSGTFNMGPLAWFEADQAICWADGACMLLRREMVQEIGLLDANMAFIGSDSDYCFTARSRGWEVWSAAAARGTHERGGSGESANQALELQKIRDMLYFGEKWLSSKIYRKLAHPSEMSDPCDIENLCRRMRAILRNYGEG